VVNMCYNAEVSNLFHFLIPCLFSVQRYAIMRKYPNTREGVKGVYHSCEARNPPLPLLPLRLHLFASICVISNFPVPLALYL
jgi:hypothetical protein